MTLSFPAPPPGTTYVASVAVPGASSESWDVEINGLQVGATAGANSWGPVTLGNNDQLSVSTTGSLATSLTAVLIGTAYGPGETVPPTTPASTGNVNVVSGSPVYVVTAYQGTGTAGPVVHQLASQARLAAFNLVLGFSGSQATVSWEIVDANGNLIWQQQLLSEDTEAISAQIGGAPGLSTTVAGTSSAFAVSVSIPDLLLPEGAYIVFPAGNQVVYEGVYLTLSPQ